MPERDSGHPNGSGNGSVPTLAILHAIELVALLGAARVVADSGYARVALPLLTAAAMVGWQAIHLIRGRRVLSVPGLAIQSALLISAVAMATQRPIAGLTGVVVAGGVLAGWGRLRDRPTAPPQPSAPPLTPLPASHPSSHSVEPQFHHWHHAREPVAYNSNYAGEFPALDALFGTLYLPAHQWPSRYGIDDVEPEGYLGQLMWPLTATTARRRPSLP